MPGHVVAALERQLRDLARVLVRLRAARELVPQPSAAWAGAARVSFDGCTRVLASELERALAAAELAHAATRKALSSAWARDG